VILLYKTTRFTIKVGGVAFSYPPRPCNRDLAGWEMKMQEGDALQQIKNYRQKIEHFYAIDEHIRTIEREKYGGSRTEFYNPDDTCPMRLALYLSFLDVTPLEEAMKPYYKRLKSVQYLASMGRTMIFMKVRQLTPDGMAHHLKTYPTDAELLGYERKTDGTFKTPDGETIRHNLKNRFGVDGIKKIDQAILIAMERAAEKLGIDFGECCGSDAFPLKAVRSDTAADFNGHYGIPGYKATTTESYNEETGIVPLVGTIIGINDDEGKELIPQLQQLQRCGIYVKEDFVDGKYATIENIAQTEIIQNTRLQYNIADNWVYNDGATPSAIKTEYQKFHHESEFMVNASEEFMMRYLVKKECGETVGYMLRNQHIAAKEECPDSYLDHFHRRNITESENDRIKNDHGLQQAIRRKGKETVDLQFHLAFLALHVLALVRLQNGSKNHLVSKRGLT
jgi:hypothetical protein